MSSLLAAVSLGGLASLAGCNDTAVVLRIASNQPLDSICVGLDAAGAHRFGRRYSTAMSPLPQTLSVLAGGRSQFQEVVYGYRRAQPAARVVRELPFKSGQIDHLDVTLDACAPQPVTSGAFAAAAPVSGAFDRAVVTPSPSGPVVLAVVAGNAARFSFVSGALTALAGGTGSPPEAASTALVAGDVDGDCQLDTVFLPQASLWTRALDGSFVEQMGAVPATGSDAAIGDLDGDGNPDLLVAGGNAVHLLVGDGAGHFHEQPSAFDVAPTDATRVALGDLDGDGNLDVIIGQGSATPAIDLVYLNQKGTGHFAYASASLPPVKAKTTALAIGDVDGDGHLDLVVAYADAPLRLYLNRGDAYFEDRSFPNLPDRVSAMVPTLALADVNLDCTPDLIVPRAGGAPLVWLNSGGMFTPGPALAAPESTGAVVDDLDGDGKPDLLLYGANGLYAEVQK